MSHGKWGSGRDSIFADAVGWKVELERAGMLVPETGWERSLPTSPAHSRRAQSSEFLRQLGLICQ